MTENSVIADNDTATTTDEGVMLETLATTTLDLNLEVSTTTSPAVELFEVSSPSTSATSSTTEETFSQSDIAVVAESILDISLPSETLVIDPFQLSLETDWREACIRGAFVASGYESTGECLNDRRPY